MKATCNCGRALSCIKIGVDVLVQTDFGSGLLPYQLYRADVWGCIKCGTQFALMNNDPYAEHFHDNFKDKLEKAKHSGYLWIQNP